MNKIKKDKNIYIVKDGVRYRIRFCEDLDCIEHCSFRRTDKGGYCNRNCYLPKWAKQVQFEDWTLERVDPKVELLKAVKDVAK